MVDWYEVLQIAIGLLVSIVVPFIVKFLKEKSHSEKYKKLLSMADVAVQFAQQKYAQEGGEIRFDKASSWLSQQSKKIGLKLEESEVEALIESALKRGKAEFGEQWKKQK